jgi:hypothetical protein
MTRGATMPVLPPFEAIFLYAGTAVGGMFFVWFFIEKIAPEIELMVKEHYQRKRD